MKERILFTMGLRFQGITMLVRRRTLFQGTQAMPKKLIYSTPGSNPTRRGDHTCMGIHT